VESDSSPLAPSLFCSCLITPRAALSCTFTNARSTWSPTPDTSHSIHYRLLSLDSVSGGHWPFSPSTSLSPSPSTPLSFLFLLHHKKLTLLSIYLPNPIYHELAFASILLSSTARLLYLLHRLPATHTSKSKIIKTLLTGIGFFAGGFVVWNIDNIFCDQLKAIRGVVGPHLGMLVQGHGYWHLGTSYGSYLIFVSANCEYSIAYLSGQRLIF
jgi:hypothetical protein